MSKNYVGVGALTYARTESGGYTQIYAGDPVPGGLDKDDLKRLVDEGFLAEVATVEPSADSKPDTVEAILAEVGDDKEKAAAALAAENAKDKPRSTLVSKLEAIANPQV